ncbi:PLP-dependent transferase [Violaceomyces palustris]|uniref:PLP-dependent transferase n=1 Tax=Violaceomyces palustris TaxID=1673888 RepID=A0ACD0P5X8_9BASI|nr:PLP-dependent transferase [Violaceomyces palustris]
MSPSAQISTSVPATTIPTKVMASSSKKATSCACNCSSDAATTSQAIQVQPSRFLSAAAKARPPSAIRSLFPAELIPGMLSLLAGKPNPTTFPIAEISMTLKPDAVDGMGEDGQGKKLEIKGKDLETALQYGYTSGTVSTLKWLTDFQSRVHGREIVNQGDKLDGVAGRTPWRITIGVGSQDLLNKAFEALVNPGDVVLVESPVYTGILPSLEMLKAKIVPIESDSEGLSSVELAKILAEWGTTPLTKGLAAPKLLYTTPTGANPAGTTASDQRKREVLKLAREYDFMIMEDDPYYYLSFEGLGQDPVTRTRSRCYWSLEEEGREVYGTGRVLRFESFSKILAAGLRLGFATGPEEILEAIDMHTAMANLQPSGVAQAVAQRLFDHWGVEGFLRHVDQVASFYEKRRDNFEEKARRILGEVAEWVTPVAGMFLWLKLKLPPSAEGDDQGDSFALISERAKAAGVLAVPGMAFMPRGDKTCYVRTSFSLIEEENVEEAFQRLRGVILDAWKESGLELNPL